MNRLLATFFFLTSIGISLAFFPDGFVALLVAAPILVTVVFALRKRGEEGTFLIRLFLAAFFVRALVACLIVGFELQMFFGEDSIAHNYFGTLVYEYWSGIGPQPTSLNNWQMPWGLYYLIGVVYYVVGPTPLAINFISCAAGAMTSVFVYLSASEVFKSSRVAKVAAVMCAFFPAMIIWSSQIMKDGFVTFFVVAVIYFLLRLQSQFSLQNLAFLLIGLLGIVSVRFYIFYFSLVACLGSFFLGSERLVRNGLRWSVIVAVLTVGLAYTGLLSIGKEQVERIGNIESIQVSREVLSRDAQSGYGGESDITTASGAAVALPVGLINLLLAPFPWQFTSVRSMMPLPEMLVWWASFPFLVVGVVFTLRHRFRVAIPIVFFTFTLMIAYALFQTNVGTAYRQRTQIQVFFFMFIAVGFALFRERQEDRRLIVESKRRGLDRAIGAQS